MSFDLHFYCGDVLLGGWDGLFAWAAERPAFTRRAQPNGGFSLVYENPDTGVYFTLLQAHPPPLNAATRALSPAYLSANLNYARCRFFALEVMDVIVDLVAKLSLVVYDPQSGFLGKPTAASLVESWCRGNQHAVAAIRAREPGFAPWMDTRAAEGFWRYRAAHPSLKARYGGDGLVPQLVAVRRGDRALRIAHLPKPCIYVVPPTDLFFIDRGEGALVVGAEQVRAALGHLFVPLAEVEGAHLVPETKIFDASAMDAWDRFHAEVGVEGPLKALYQGVAADGFVDC